MTQISDTSREIGRLREQRPIKAPSAQNDNHAGDGLCPVCKGYASIGQKACEYCGKELVRRHWLCRACGHEWVTVLHVHA